MKLEEELKNLRTTSEGKLREDSHQFDQCLDASSNKLNTFSFISSDSLLQVSAKH